MNNLIPQWLDLDGAVNYLAIEKINISKLLEFGRLGKLPMYALVPAGTQIQYWDTEPYPPVRRTQAIAEPLRINSDTIYQVQERYPNVGYAIKIDSPIPKGCTFNPLGVARVYEALEFKPLNRGITLKTHESIRILRKDIDALKILLETNPINLLKRSAMAKVVNDIRKKSTEPNSKSLIWAALKALAVSKNPPAPIVGYTGEGIQYHGKKFDDDGDYDIYSKKALGSYMDRNLIP